MKSKKLLREVNFFYMLACAGTGVLFVLTAQLCRVLSVTPTFEMLVTTMAAQLAPGLAAFICAKRAGTKLSVKLTAPKPISLLFVVLVPLVVIGAQSLLFEQLGQGAIPSAFFASAPLIALVIVTTVLGSIGEEIGWRYYLHGTLRQHMKPWLSSALSGLLWGLWHFPKIFQQGLGFYLVFALSLIPLGMILCYSNEKSQGSLLPSILLHTVFNLSVMYFLFERESLSGHLVSTAVLCLMVLVIRLVDRQYFRQGKEALSIGP